MSMVQMLHVDWLRTELDASIAFFKREADKHKRLHERCRYSIFALTALSAILAAAALVVPDKAQKILNVTVVATSALIGAAASVEGMRKPADKWHTERRAEYALLDIKRELEFGIRAASDELKVNDLYVRMAAILKSSGESWSKHLQSAQGQGQQGLGQPTLGQPAPEQLASGQPGEGQGQQSPSP